ncbi:PREDICTED: putative E3 ubiquitin-protein ligase XBAT34 isoform X2 [Lupinus angustifolius]|uniref:putative E3 ubiquitin-protein ligase XBAT34 isoform X1 n=1 Tax=Lupinus angustifolius TaxID=3871 RepID=UPI00092F1A22|nr:PREDICTED: putative E3 ubiquitin-protein ligase XBAT34 isoform X1 [Lupinus angustifolius]XP_019432761.1 PREDICTED: putative E3 ubiquitin-protein ligase XBAT34 isoform X2 [Lupinus angustifolius]
MGQSQSKGELLYQQVSYGNVEGIKSLHREGAGLEWMDREGKTPLIVACMNPELYNVAKTLIELGANINAYRPGRNAGTPLHHAAKRGLESIVKLLLSHGANALVLNDDCQTALEVARAKGHTNVVRAFESHLCLFSGWLREFHGPGFLEVVAPQLVSRKVWVVVLPAGFRNLTRPYKLELVIYSTMQDARPRTIIALWKANLEEPNLRQSDPTVTIVATSTTTKTRIRLGPVSENDRQQLTWFSNACKGIPQVNPEFLCNDLATAPPTAPPAAEDPELAMAIHASLQHAINDRPPFPDAHQNFEASSSSGVNNASKHGFVGTESPNTSESVNLHEAEQGGNNQHVQILENDNVSAGHTTSGLDFNPSAPPVTDAVPDDVPIQYPSIDSSPIDMSSPVVEKLPKEGKNADGNSSICVICLDAPAEGACIPCGHVAGCMSCLNEVKTKKWGCPVCRAKIDQVIKLYHV